MNSPANLGLKQRLAFLLKDSSLYGGAAMANKAFSLITFPLVTRYFSVADFGLISYFSACAGLLATLFVFGQDSAVARYFYEYPDEASRRQLITQSLLFQAGCLVLLLPVLWGVADVLGGRLYDSPQAGAIMKIVVLQIPCSLLINFAQNLLKWTFSRTRFLVISMGSVVLNLVTIVVAILALKIDVRGFFAVTLACSSVFAMLGLYFVRRWLALPRGLVFLPELLRFAFPYGVTCVTGAFVPVLERGLVVGLIGASELGLYAAGTSVAMLLSLFVGAFQTAWGPFSLAIHKEADAAATYDWVLKCFSLAACVATLLLSAVARPLIVLLASSRYEGAAIVVFPLAFGLAVQATSWITEIGIGISKKSHLSLYGYLAMVGVTLAAIWALVPFCGLLGVPLGVMSGHVAKAFLSTALAQRAYRVPWSFRPVLRILAGTWLVGMAGMLLPSGSSPWMASGAYGAGAILILGLSWGVLFDPADREKLLRFARGRCARSS